MEIRLDRVPPQEKDILYRLLQYSLFEESGTDGNEMTKDAVFEYDWFDCYFDESEKFNRYAYFIRESDTGRLLGFAMVNTHTVKFSTGYSIAEFLVIPKYRRLGIGRRAAIECFGRFPGNWEVSPSYGSEKAYSFWKNVIDEYTGNKNRFEDGIFLFSNG